MCVRTMTAWSRMGTSQAHRGVSIAGGTSQPFPWALYWRVGRRWGNVGSLVPYQGSDLAGTEPFPTLLGFISG